MVFCLLGLGSNLGVPQRQLLLAHDAIKRLPKTRIIEMAPLYRNQAWGKKALPDYYNTVLLIETSLNPFRLLNACQQLEKNQGRVRRVRYQARTLDIDILIYEKLKLQHPRLTLPHPRMNEREFVRVPIEKLKNVAWVKAQP